MEISDKRFSILMACVVVLIILGTIGVICCFEYADKCAMIKTSNERIADHIRIFHNGTAPANNVIKTRKGGRKVMCDSCIKQAINGNPHIIPEDNDYLVYIRGY